MKSLTQAKHRKDQLIARVRAAGIPVAVDAEKDQVPDLSIRQDIEAYDSTIFDVNGGAGLIIPLTIIPNMPVFFFSGFGISLPRWPDALLRPLEENYRGEWPRYQFYERSDYKFDQSQALNHFIAQQKEVRRGRPIHGLLLAFSYDPMPDNLARGDILRGSIKIYDQWEQAHPADIALRVDREAERKCKRIPDPKRKERWDAFRRELEEDDK